MDDYQILSTFFKYKDTAMVRDVFEFAFSRTNLSEEQMEQIANILTEASEQTDYHMRKKEKRKEETEKEQKEPEVPKETPASIKKYLDQHIIGQEEAKKACAIAVYNHLNGHTRNLLLTGNTGCGKTEIWRALSKKFDFIRIINCPQISGDGWEGSYHMSDIFLYEDPSILDHMIVVFDEFDKMLEPQIASGVTDHAKLLQNELLKLMDGDEVTYRDDRTRKSVTVDGSKISMIFCGSFATMRKNISSKTEKIGFGRDISENVTFKCTASDLVKHANMRLEIAGRLDRIVVLDDMTAKDFERILDSEASPVNKISEEYHVQIVMDAASKKKLANFAAENKMGCRYLRSEIQRRLDNALFFEPDKQQYNLSDQNDESAA